MSKPKVLILRFSSLGDVTQGLSVAHNLSQAGYEVHWAVRIDLAPLIEYHPCVSRVWKLERRDGFIGLIKLLMQLREAEFTHVYDAHNSLRSRFLYWSLFFFPPFVLNFYKRKFITRPINRWKRWLWIKFKINLFNHPQGAQFQLLSPLKKWNISQEIPPTPQFFIDSVSALIAEKEKIKYSLSDFIVLCPSAAHELKRWPLENWAFLIQSLSHKKFVLLGGPKDKFLSDLVSLDPDRVFDFSGRLSLLESAYFIQQSVLVVTNDTGLMHISEQLGKLTLALMGPAPFGYPSRPSTIIFEKNLACRPCSKHGQGPCVNPEYQACLKQIKPQEVCLKIKELLGESSP